MIVGQPLPSSWYRRWFANLMLIFASLMGTFLMLEVLSIGVLPEPIVWLNPQERYIPHPILVHQLKPNQNSFTHSFPVTTNSYGLRDHEFPVTLNANTFRMVCLGDSLTFGVGVRLEDTYAKQLESLLNSNKQRKYEVINAGVPAYDTWQEIAYLREYGWRFAPDLVIIGFYANDVVPKPNPIPRVVSKSGSIRTAGLNEILPDATVYLLKRSRLLLLLKDRYGKLVNQLRPSPEYRHKLSMLTGTTDQFVERGWQQVEASFKELVPLRKKHGFQLLVVVFPMEDQLLGRYPSAKYQSRLKEIAQSYNIDLLDLLPAFQRNFNGFASLFLEWDGHPNAKAHAIAASEIERYYFQHMAISNTKGAMSGSET
ncbi:MAG: SGNH/GDSL hydrolase family protein [Nitrososphaera sp.]